MPKPFRYIYDDGDACWIDCLPGNLRAERFGPLHWKRLPNTWRDAFPEEWRGQIFPVNSRKGAFICAITGRCFTARIPARKSRRSRRSSRTLRFLDPASSRQGSLPMRQQIENAWIRVHGKFKTPKLPPSPMALTRSISDHACHDSTNHQVVATDGEVYDTYFPCSYFQ